jgi:hypothetical protein
MKNRNKLVMAAVAGMALGAAAPATQAQTKPGEVQCYGINGCTAEAKCAVSKEDLAAVKKLVGEADYAAKWSKSEAHTCSGKGSCGAGAQILNWAPATAKVCKEKNGFTISTVKGQKVAKKA